MRKEGDTMFDIMQYETKNDNALYKGIPAVYRYHPAVRDLMKTRLFSVKYRGRSKEGYKRPQNYCHKDYAETFAIYPYSSYSEYSDLKKQYLGHWGYNLAWGKLRNYLKDLSTFVGAK